MTAAAKQSKPEVIIKQPKDSPLLKIIDKVKAKLLTSKHGARIRQAENNAYLSPVLVIILLLVVMNAVKKSPKTSAKPSKNATAAAAAFDGKINWEMPQVIPANSQRPDGFRMLFPQFRERKMLKARSLKALFIVRIILVLLLATELFPPETLLPAQRS